MTQQPPQEALQTVYQVAQALYGIADLARLDNLDEDDAVQHIARLLSLLSGPLDLAYCVLSDVVPKGDEI